MDHNPVPEIFCFDDISLQKLKKPEYPNDAENIPENDWRNDIYGFECANWTCKCQCLYKIRGFIYCYDALHLQ